MAQLRSVLWMGVLSAVVMIASSIAAAGTPQGVATPNTTTQNAAAQTSSRLPFDVNASIEAYLAKMPPAQRAKSDAYFEGGYWLQLWDFLSTVIVMWVLLRFGWSARMRDLAKRITRFSPLQTAIYWIQFIIVTSVITFPLTIYEGYVREHKYGLLNQNFAQWMRDELVALAIIIVLGAILVIPLFGLVRRLGKNWWVWGSVLTLLFLALVSLIAPVYLSPLFNHYKKLQDPRIKDPILSMARAQGIPATDVYEFDASRQSNRVSANVSGLGNTLRISLNDNLLNRCTLAEIETTMGHEMGHYVMNHIYKGLVMNGVVLVIGFAFLNWGIIYALARWGQTWNVHGITDVAVIPLAVIVFSIFSLATTPVNKPSRARWSLKPTCSD